MRAGPGDVKLVDVNPNCPTVVPLITVLFAYSPVLTVWFVCVALGVGDGDGDGLAVALADGDGLVVTFADGDGLADTFADGEGDGAGPVTFAIGML